MQAGVPSERSSLGWKPPSLAWGKKKTSVRLTLPANTKKGGKPTGLPPQSGEYAQIAFALLPNNTLL
jgi:hypothetical protein